MEGEALRAGVISCSGEDLCEGTISRLATRKVLEQMRPGRTVTLCLPLFLAGEEQERDFARAHPTIVVDGCDKACARVGTERYSGPVSAAVVVTDLVPQGVKLSGQLSTRRLSADELAVVDIVANHLASEVDRILGPGAFDEVVEEEQNEVMCSCGKPLPKGEIVLDGHRVTLVGLPLIFGQLAASGVQASDASGPKLLEAVRVYNPIPDGQDSIYQESLLEAYRAYRAQL
jgi:hypothetical protein